MKNGWLLQKYLRSQRSWVEELLYSLLKIPSISGEEDAALHFLREWLLENGIPCESVPIGRNLQKHEDYSDPIKGLRYDDKYNLSSTIPGNSGNNKIIVLNSHIDVVAPSPGQKGAYQPYCDEDGYIYARGACDAKGQLAVMCLLLKTISELGPIANTIVGHIVIEEEFGGNGTLGLLEAQPEFHADAMINLEPTDLRLMTSVRGAIWFEMLFTGVAGHSGSNKTGANVINEAIEAIRILKKYHSALYERSRDYGLFKDLDNSMPFNMGTFNSGSWPSVIPEEAHISGLLGILPNVDKWQVMDELREVFDHEEHQQSNIQRKLHFTYHHNAVETITSHWLVKGMQEASRNCGLSGSPTAMTASTDAVFYQERGIPALVFGPGSIADAHSKHERIAIEDILQAVEVLFRFVKTI